MSAWWEALSTFQQVFICVAVPATLLMIVQFILTLIGIGEGVDSDADGNFDTDGAELDDFDADGDLDGDAGDADGAEDPFNFGIVFRLFTLRGLIAFLAVMGWVGYGLDETALPIWAVVLISIAAGLVMMILIAGVYALFRKLQTSGNVDIRNALGKAGSVYLTVPAKRNGTGKINLVVQEKLGEYEAVTDEESAIPFGTEVVVIGISGQSTLVVRRK